MQQPGRDVGRSAVELQSNESRMVDVSTVWKLTASTTTLSIFEMYRRQSIAESRYCVISSLSYYYVVCNAEKLLSKKRSQFGRRKALTISDDDCQQLTRQSSDKSSKTKCLTKFWHNFLRYSDTDKSQQQWWAAFLNYSCLRSFLRSIFRVSYH